MKTIKQNLFSATFIMVLLFNFSNQIFANKIATFMTSIKGGIASDEYNFTPYIAFKGDTPLFSTRVVTTADEGVTFVIASDFDDGNYTTFINKLTNTEDEMLSIGHKIGKIKTDVSNRESNWFEGLNVNKDEITYITLTYTNLKFETSATNEWTIFSYELTVSIFNGNDLDGISFININIDNDTDGIGLASIDYETAELLEGDFASKGDTEETGKIMVKKVQEGIFIVVREDDKNDESKKSVQIMFLSSKKQ
jgi:hypothetical protein